MYTHTYMHIIMYTCIYLYIYIYIYTLLAGILECRGRVRDEDDGQVVQHHRGAHDEHQGDHLPASLCGRNQSSECRQPRVHSMKVRGDAHACTYAVMHMSAQSREHVCINCLAEHPRVHELSDIYVVSFCAQARTSINPFESLTSSWTTSGMSRRGRNL